MIAETLSAWATSLGIEARTLERKLVKAGFDSPKPNSKIPAKKIMVAIVGDESAEKNRLLKAQADAQERENRTADENWFEREEVQGFIASISVPIRNLIVTAPDTLEMKSRAEIEQWTIDGLKYLDGELPKKKGTK